MKPISLKEIATLGTAKQHFCDCYLVSTISALSQSKKGTRILQNNILRDADNFKINFKNINGNSEDYFVSQKEMDNLILVDQFVNPIKIEVPHNPLIKAIEVAMNKMIKRHPLKKSFFNRLVRCDESFEYNRPSRFLEMFTGIKPIAINESGIRMTLKKKKSEVLEILTKIARDKDSAFIFGTGARSIGKLNSWHCYTINDVDPAKKIITVYDHRKTSEMQLSFEDAINKFKFITGYFGENFK